MILKKTYQGTLEALCACQQEEEDVNVAALGL